MRVTIDSDDADFIGRDNFGRFRVMFNGAPLNDCVEADDVNGYAVVFMRDDQGRFEIDREKYEVRRLRVQGLIKIVDCRAL